LHLPAHHNARAQETSPRTTVPYMGDCGRPRLHYTTNPHYIFLRIHTTSSQARPTPRRCSRTAHTRPWHSTLAGFGPVAGGDELALQRHAHLHPAPRRTWRVPAGTTAVRSGDQE